MPNAHTQSQASASCTPRRWLHSYLRKLRGAGEQRLPVPGPVEAGVSWLGAFLGIFAVSGLNQVLKPILETSILIPSLGATAVLLFGVPESKLSQPRNVMCGQLVSATIGIATRNVLGSVLWLSAPVGMSLALLAMRLLAITHPPGLCVVLYMVVNTMGSSWWSMQWVTHHHRCLCVTMLRNTGGATALFAASAITPAPWAGWMFLPAIMLSTTIMLLIALLINNVRPMATYPRYWWGANGVFK